ncbi:hypothetical protein F2Q70_00018965 [Brassica cretica]|uniref:Uncharacterized protein n=1 Tax=Brassica cretica TaxID=69181 RepID=A0A3N6QU33_BRACR|nr:hypothetical protein F2Q70_00018965 [Brassica cretica]KAF2599927.1 hypothetical protein F2Q68_00012547 [Brassica cretica]
MEIEITRILLDRIGVNRRRSGVLTGDRTDLTEKERNDQLILTMIWSLSSPKLSAWREINSKVVAETAKSNRR